MHLRTLPLLASSAAILFASPSIMAQPEPPAAPERAPEPPAPPPEAPEPPAPPAVAPPVAAPEPAPSQDPTPPLVPGARPVEAPSAPPPPQGPTQILIGKEGFFQPGALLQGWFWVTDQARLSGEKRPRRTSSFRLRRAELRIKGEIVPKLVSYQVMIDPAKALEFDKKKLDVQGQEPAPTTPGTVTADQPNGSTSIMQDFFITFLSDWADVSIGQFKIPVSWEGYGSSSKLIFPERSLVSRRYGDRRDLGVRIEKKLGDHFLYSAGVFNGDGQNRADSNNQKDVALRLEGYPIKGVMLGVVGYTSVGQRNEATTKDRLEGDVRVELANVLAQGEYIRGWDGPADETRLQGHGFYGALGYTLLDKIQPVVRVGYLDPNLKGDATGKDDEVWHYEADVNYFIQKHEAKLQLSYSLFDFDELKKRTEVILAAQASF